jgi:hypothetical protein
MFTKTDLAKFENVWDDHPKWVNRGAQKNFVQYASRIGMEWAKAPDGFNEFHYRRAIARGLIFRRTEKLVSNQPWYNGGYRANIVAYAIAALGDLCRSRGRSIDFLRVWNTQDLIPSLENAIAVSAKFVNQSIIEPPAGISNISEWCKKEACWEKIQGRISDLDQLLPREFWTDLIPIEEQKARAKDAKKTQKIDNGIDAQKKVFEVPSEKWALILQEGVKRKFLSPKEVGILKIAQQIPLKIPSEKQSAVLVEVLGKAAEEGIIAE